MKIWLILVCTTLLFATCTQMEPPQEAARQKYGVEARVSQHPEPFEDAPFHSFRYQADFYPSFLAPASATIQLTKHGGYLTWTLYAPNMANVVTFTDSVTLSGADMRRLFASLDSSSVLTMTTQEQLGTDGIFVHNRVWQDTLHNTFRFWSPRKQRNPAQHRVAVAILDIVRRKVRAPQAQEYGESLEQYFDLGLPCKVVRTNPCEVRLYGSLSADRQADLTQFMQALPTTRSVVVDMRNFESMGTILYPIFRQLVARNPRVTWVASGYAREQLQELGIAQSHIVTTLEEGRKRAKQL